MVEFRPTLFAIIRTRLKIMTEGPPQEGDQALRDALRETWKTSEEELEALVPRPKEGDSTIRKMQAVLLIVVKPLSFLLKERFLKANI